ncbi:MAG: 50S ribosomal protein L4 [Pseudomonadota bacterium]
MELQIQSFESGSSAGNMTLSDAVFACDYNEPLIHQVVTAHLAGARSGTKKQKSRSDVRGGGEKPWRQKGLGRARSGTNSSPIWRSGGATFAARPRDYSQKVNRKMYRAAITSILSELVRQERLLIVDDVALNEAKTKQLVTNLKNLNVENVLLVTEEINENVFLASRNLHKVGVVDVETIDPTLLIGFDHIVISKEAMTRLEERLK